jgi:6-pyruvoyltetrahydropterin/6-carboxytetrahydropterin synthase
MPVVEVSYEVDFEAAHWLPHVADNHKCKRMHGHSYRVVITVAGFVSPFTGMVVDYADIKAAAEPLVAQLDHHTVNDTVPNSTSENLAVWFWDNLAASLPLSAVTVYETPRAYSTYRGQRG